MLLYWILLPTVWVLAPIVFRIQVIGRENLKAVRDGRAYVIAPNHIANLDPVLIAITIFDWKRLRILAKEELFKNPLAGWFLRCMGAVSIERGKGDTVTLEKITNECKNGTGVMIFPEGACYSRVTPEDVPEIVSEHIVKGRIVQRLLHMEDILHKRVVGQDEAVKAVARAIRRGRVGLKDPKRPIGSFLFLGPTGVGKTELCKSLAEAMFGDENAMIRIDMSEYMERHTVSRLVGSPPGYVGHDEGGQLTEKVRRKPYSVVLFDEIEKAHEDVWNILLQILEDGVVTDSQGRRVDFKNTVIVMTSNVGARNITADAAKLGFDGKEKDETESDEARFARIREAVMTDLKHTFRPEFLNRIDEIIVFRQLTQENIVEIARRMLAITGKRMAQQGITLAMDDDAVEALAKDGFDPQYGARPLRRAIQNQVEDAVAEQMLEGQLKSGDTARICLRDGKVVIAKDAAEAAAPAATPAEDAKTPAEK